MMYRSCCPKDTVEADIDVRVRMLNINHGHNRKLMRSCRVLSEYAWFIKKVRTYSRTMDIEAAVDKALDEMPKDYEIRGFLFDNKAEVKDMCLTEYNEAETMELFKDEGRAEGEAAGEAKQLIRQICRKLAKGKDTGVIADELEEDPGRVEEICTVAADFAPEYDPEKIYNAMQEKEQTVAG